MNKKVGPREEQNVVTNKKSAENVPKASIRVRYTTFFENVEVSKGR